MNLSPPTDVVAADTPRARLRQIRGRVVRHAPIILLLALFWFVEWRAADFGDHWDEHTQRENVQRSLETDNFLPQSDGGVPTLPPVAVRGFYGYPSMLHLLGLASIAPKALSGYSRDALISFVGTQQFYLNLRLLCVTLCTLALLWIYLAILSICGSRFSALFGASTLAVSWEFQYHSRWIATDALCAQFAALVALLAVYALRSHRTEYLIRAAVAAGLAASTKYPSGALIVIPVSALLTWRPIRIRTIQSAKLLLRLLIAFGVAFLVITPGAILQPKHFFWWLEYSRVMYSTGFYCYTVATHLSYAWKLICYLAVVAWSPVPALSMLVAGMGVLGLVALGGSFRRFALPVLLFPAIFFLFLCSQRVLIIRNVLPILPFVSIVAGLGLFWLQERTSQPVFKATAVCVVLLPVLYNLGWTLRASETISSRSLQGWRPSDRFRRFASGHPQYRYRFSQGVRQLLTQAAPGLLNREADEQTAPENELFAMNPREGHWAEGSANNPVLLFEDFGPFDVNLDYYPTWVGSDHIVLLTRTAIASNKGSRFWVKGRYLEGQNVRQAPETQPDRGYHEVAGVPAQVEAYLGSAPPSIVRAARTFAVLQGEPYKWDVAKTGAPMQLETGYYSWQSLEFKVDSLRSDRGYELGITWWDFDGGGRSESIEVENSAGGDGVELLAAYQLPAYFNPQTKSGPHSLPVSLAFKIPKKLYSNGSFRVKITRASGSNAIVSEMWVVEQNQ